MKTMLSVVLVSAHLMTPAIAQEAVVTKGRMVRTVSGVPLGVVQRVDANGSAQIILDGKVVWIPAATLTTVDGKLTTSLSKQEVRQAAISR